MTTEQLERLVTALDSLPYRERLNLLFTLGVPATEAMGLEGCEQHWGWHPLAESAPLSFVGDVAWCKECRIWVQM